MRTLLVGPCAVGPSVLGLLQGNSSQYYSVKSGLNFRVFLEHLERPMFDLPGIIKKERKKER
jgi:hypothetical protein